MPHPLVVHCKDSNFDVYVGRKSRGAPDGATGFWGNPFQMQNPSDAERDRVIMEYQAWLLAQPELMQRARSELRGRRLACWCAPKPCHADVLARIANDAQLLQQQSPPPSSVAAPTPTPANHPQGRPSSRAGNDNKRSPLCRFFAKGNCKYGANCKFSHHSSGNMQTAAVENANKEEWPSLPAAAATKKK